MSKYSFMELKAKFVKYVKDSANLENKGKNGEIAELDYKHELLKQLGKQAANSNLGFDSEDFFWLCKEHEKLANQLPKEKAALLNEAFKWADKALAISEKNSEKYSEIAAWFYNSVALYFPKKQEKYSDFKSHAEKRSALMNIKYAPTPLNVEKEEINVIKMSAEELNQQLLLAAKVKNSNQILELLITAQQHTIHIYEKVCDKIKDFKKEVTKALKNRPDRFGEDLKLLILATNEKTILGGYFYLPRKGTKPSPTKGSLKELHTEITKRKKDIVSYYIQQAYQKLELNDIIKSLKDLTNSTTKQGATFLQAVKLLEIEEEANTSISKEIERITPPEYRARASSLGAPKNYDPRYFSELNSPPTRLRSNSLTGMDDNGLDPQMSKELRKKFEDKNSQLNEDAYIQPNNLKLNK